VAPRPGGDFVAPGNKHTSYLKQHVCVHTEGDLLVYVVNRSPRNLSITCDCMVYWLSKKSVLEKIVTGNQKIGYQAGLYYILYSIFQQITQN
jgi:hypothetical protein